MCSRHTFDHCQWRSCTCMYTSREGEIDAWHVSYKNDLIVKAQDSSKHVLVLQNSNHFTSSDFQ